MQTVGFSLVFLAIFLPFGYSIISEFRIWLAKIFGFRQNAVIPTLVVGNLTVGGAGKSPFVQFLAHKLQKNAVLLRGYGRKTNGFLSVTENSCVDDVGDEALEHFQEGLSVFVGEDRLNAVKEIHQIHGDLDLVILDDGLQHVNLEPDFGLLLTDYQNPFWREKFSVPIGKLRQFKSSANNFDAWVITKCPKNISKQEIEGIRVKTELPVFFAAYSTSEPQQCYGREISLEKDQKLGLITGIVNGRRLRQTLENREFDVVMHWEYSDHYLFQIDDYNRWITESKKQGIDAWICSRKDFMRMKSVLNEIAIDVPIFEVHTEVEIINSEEKELLNLIKSKMIK